MMLPATCVLLPTRWDTEHILAISRRNDTTQWGIPGGKVDPGESNIHAAMREIKEECGLVLDPRYLEPVYVGPCYGKDGRDFWVTTYLFADAWDPDNVVTEEGLVVREFHLRELCNLLASPFAPYNQNVLAAWRTFKMR